MTPYAELMERVERQHGVVTLEALLGAGVGERQAARLVDAGRLVRMERGVLRVGGSPCTEEARILAAVLVHGDETWASHRTAARVWRIPGIALDGRLEVLRPDGLSNQRAGARVHRSQCIPDHHVTTHRGIPVTSVPRTIFDLARSTGPRRLDRLIRGALRDRLCTPAGLYLVLHELGRRGRPGTRRLREALDGLGDAYVPTDSELEEVARACLAGVPGIEWQVEVSDEQGYVRRVDGLHRAARLVIEIDGMAWHSSPEAVERDAAGDERLAALGYVIERLTWVDLARRSELTRQRVERLVLAVAS